MVAGKMEILQVGGFNKDRDAQSKCTSTSRNVTSEEEVNWTG